jgi:recombination protein RecA
LDIRRIGSIKSGEEVLGNRTRVKVVKNKMAPPFKQVEFDLVYGEGVSREGDLIDLASDSGIIEKTGTWFSYGKDRIGQGRDNAKEFLKAHPQIADEIERKLKEHYGLAVPPVREVKTPPPDDTKKKRA